MRRLLPALLLAIAACSSAAVPIDDVPVLPAANPATIDAILAGGDRPIVLNVWASWCGPCRSEAPLLRSAVAEHGNDVQFIGVAVRDDQAGARAFIAEFDLTGLEHYFDAAGAVPAHLGAGGVPLTFFFRPGGELVHTHRGVLDERTLALWIDDLERFG